MKARVQFTSVNGVHFKLVKGDVQQNEAAIFSRAIIAPLLPHTNRYYGQVRARKVL